MDLSKAIVYNGLSINSVSRTSGGVPMSGYAVERVEWQTTVDQFLAKRATQDGMDAADIYLGLRNVTLIVSVYGSTAGDFWDKVQDLNRAFAPLIAYISDSSSLGFLPLTFSQPTANITTWPTSAYPSGIPLQFYLRPNGPPSLAIEDAPTSSLGYSKRFAIPMIARDPRKYLQVAQSSATVSSPLGNTILTYRGDYPIYPSALTMPINANTATGKNAIIDVTPGTGWMAYMAIGSFTVSFATSASSSVYVLDWTTRTLTKDGVTRMDLLTNNYWPMIGPGSSISTSGSLSGQPWASNGTISYREGFA